VKVSLIINTACGDPRIAGERNPWREYTYGDRVEMVHRIVKECTDFDEIIVAGVFEPSAEGLYTYVSITQQYGDRRDALLQREIGARHATGDVLVFTHDDHLPQAPWNLHVLEEDGWDILVPKRIHGITGEELNNGKAEGYMGGHTLCMKREAWAAVPWLTAIPPRTWDIPMTRIWRDAGLEIVWTDELISVDLEARENEV
jgi:hypothetical protein